MNECKTKSLALSILIVILLAMLLPTTTASLISGLTLTANEERLIKWIKQYTLPNTRQSNGLPWTNTSKTVAIGTWWAYSEGILNSGNFYNPNYKQEYRNSAFRINGSPPPLDSVVFSYSLCVGTVDGYPSRRQPGELIGPNQICVEECPRSSCWQTGIFGKEVSEVETVEEAASYAENIFKKIDGRQKWTYVDVVRGTLEVAGFPPSSGTYKDVDKCFGQGTNTKVASLSEDCKQLVKVWLIRNHLIGLSVNIYNDGGDFQSKCARIENYDHDCYSEKTPDLKSIQYVVDKLTVYFKT